MKKLNRKIITKELVDDVFISEKLTKKQISETDAQLSEARKKRQLSMTDNERLALDLLQLRFQLEDYVKQDSFDEERTFGYFLKEYLRLLHKKRYEFAGEIQIHETLLSQLINNHREPANNIIIRLEIHSNNTIPAVYWYQLVEKQKEHVIRTDKLIRRRERKFVTNRLKVSI